MAHSKQTTLQSRVCLCGVIGLFSLPLVVMLLFLYHFSSDSSSRIKVLEGRLMSQSKAAAQPPRDTGTVATPREPNGGRSSFPASSSREEESRPFSMPLKGERFSLFQPTYDLEQERLGPVLLSPVSSFIRVFEDRITWANSLTYEKSGAPRPDVTVHARLAFREFLSNWLSGAAFGDAERSVIPGAHGKSPMIPLDMKLRRGGEDWTFLGDTMTGKLRIHVLGELLTDVVSQSIPGDFIETGVWRGGSSVFARAVLDSLPDPLGTKRLSYVCDSFAGLPPGDRRLDAKDKNWDKMTTYLGVSEYVVAGNFQKAGVLSSNVVFAKGFFNETMPVLKRKLAPEAKFAIMRLDGDMYESTVDVLYQLYDRLSIGGYVIMDDWYGFPSKTAVEDFFASHDLPLPKIVKIDEISAYWRKTEEIPGGIQMWRYEQNRFKKKHL